MTSFLDICSKYNDRTLCYVNDLLLYLSFLKGMTLSFSQTSVALQLYEQILVKGLYNTPYPSREELIAYTKQLVGPPIFVSLN